MPEQQGYPTPDPRTLRELIREREEELRALYGDKHWNDLKAIMEDRGMVEPEAQSPPPIEGMLDDGQAETRIESVEPPSPPEDTPHLQPTIPPPLAAEAATDVEIEEVEEVEPVESTDRRPDPIPFPDLDPGLHSLSPASTTDKYVTRKTYRFTEDMDPGDAYSLDPPPHPEKLAQTEDQFEHLLHSVTEHQQRMLGLADATTSKLEELNHQVEHLRDRVESLEHFLLRSI